MLWFSDHLKLIIATFTNYTDNQPIQINFKLLILSTKMCDKFGYDWKLGLAPKIKGFYLLNNFWIRLISIKIIRYPTGSKIGRASCRERV